jgi:hypothetical protein
MMNGKSIKDLTNELHFIGPKAEWISNIMKQGDKGDTLYDVIGKDYMRNHKNNASVENKPIIKIETIPGTLGVMFDEWIKNGYDASNCIDANHPDGQDRALEAMRGFNKRGAITTEFRDSTEDQLSPPQLKYLSMLEDRYNRWLRTKK